jgi:hypothetical protein
MVRFEKVMEVTELDLNGKVRLINPEFVTSISEGSCYQNGCRIFIVGQKTPVHCQEKLDEVRQKFEYL